MRTLWLPDVLRRAALAVTTTPGWQTRGRELSGIDGVIGHHTASAATSGNAPSVRICTVGRHDLPGPLCSAVLARDGTWIIIASGVGNHAGAGAWPGFRGGNRYTIGVEAENNGLGTETWSARQMFSYARGVAAILEHLGVSEQRFCTHYEWCRPRGRKIDPRGPWAGGGDWYSGQSSVAMRNANLFRAIVAAHLNTGDDDLTPEQSAKLDKILDICDKVLRPKLDEVYVEVAAEDQPARLAGQVRALYDALP